VIESERWPGDVAAGFVHSLWAMSEWVNRRVDGVEFVDDRTVIRRTSLDFTLPAYAAPSDEERAVWLLPLTYVAKKTLAQLDVRDASGSAIPILTAQENADLTVEALCMLAGAELLAADPSSDLSVVEQIRPLISEVVRNPADIAEQAKCRIGEMIAGTCPETEGLRALGEDGFFLDFVGIFETSFVMVAVAEVPVGGRSILKFCYADDISAVSNDARSRRERFKDRMGWTPNTYEFDVPGAPLASSFHFELHAPIGTTVSECAIFDPTADDDDGQFVSFDRDGRSTVHVRAPAGSSDLCVTRVNLRASRVGWLRTCLSASIAIALLMTVTTWRLDGLVSTNVRNRPSVDVAAVLLTVVAVLAALIVRAGEHPLTSRLLFWARVAALSVTAQPFLAACMLAFGPSGSALKSFWALSAAWSVLGAAALAGTYRGPGLLRG
jgi:hypothetical protein